MYEIESDMPIPVGHNPRPLSKECKTFNALEVGQSFVCPCDDYTRIGTRIYQLARRTGKKALIRRIPMENKLRIYRTK
jgi:hypothetical protein